MIIPQRYGSGSICSEIESLERNSAARWFRVVTENPTFQADLLKGETSAPQILAALTKQIFSPLTDAEQAIAATKYKVAALQSAYQK